MTEIKLVSLCLDNFKCHRHLRLDFNGRNAVISGRNGTGKSSVYDALMWVLFGKNSQGKSEQSFEVKPLGSDGNVIDHNALTSVEVVLEVNGEKLTLLRTYREVWSTKRGSSEATFDGHTSEYAVNGVPMKKSGFQDKVNELVDEDTFRLLTSTTYFANDISWQERRAVLFKVAGVMDDAQILATSEGFAPLVESMGKLSLEDYKKKLLAEKKKFVGAKTEIPARISECQKTIEDIQGLDFAGAHAEVEVLTAKKEAISGQIVALEHSNEADKKALEIREAELELSTLESENRAYRTSQSSCLSNVQNLKMDLSDLRKRLDRKQHEFANEKAYIVGLNEKIAQYRDRWISVNGETFTAGNCPTCGQNLPAAQLQTAKAQFEGNKQKRLDDILQTANSYKESKAQAEDRLTIQQEEIGQLEAEIRQKEQGIAVAEASLVEIVDMADYAQRKGAIQARIDKLNADLYEIHHNVSDLKMKLRQEMSEINGQIGVKMGIISSQNMLEYSRKRIEELREDAQNSAECLEAIEKMLYLIEAYTRYKIKFVEDSINGMFRIARFRLFREQANGGVEDRCDVAYDGVIYGNVNTGMKVNLGIDIINTLSTAYGVRVPLFVDNSESITEWEKFNGQIIRLEAKKEDKELRVSYET